MEPDIIAVHDQVQADVTQKARVVAAYWKQLRAEGVDVYEALELTQMLQRAIFGLDADPQSTEGDDAHE